MNVLLIYATNSGSTFEVSNLISQILTEAGHQVTVKNIQEITAPDFANYEAVLLGSPSWDYEGKEGQPHHDFTAFINSYPEGMIYSDKKFAVFGLGDSNYTHFCGAVDHLVEFVTNKIQGQLVAEPLKIDQFYSNMDTGTQQVNDWVTNQLLPKLT